MVFRGRRFKPYHRRPEISDGYADSRNHFFVIGMVWSDRLFTLSPFGKLEVATQATLLPRAV